MNEVCSNKKTRIRTRYSLVSITEGALEIWFHTWCLHKEENLTHQKEEILMQVLPVEMQLLGPTQAALSQGWAWNPISLFAIPENNGEQLMQAIELSV